MRWRDSGLPGRVTGVAETEDGDLWMSGYSGITHISKLELAKWLHNFSYPVEAGHLGALDGLPGLAGDRTPEPSLVESTDGRLWFATTKAVAWLDPTQLSKNSNHVPPPVQVTSVTANGVVYRDLVGLKLPPATENIKIDFTALSALLPEKVLFRYKLDGVDTTWQESGTRRQAFYTKLSPRHYRFRVLACNNDGVWNDVGGTLNLTIAPAYYQTVWFQLVWITMMFFAAWIMFRLRLHQATRTVRVRLAAQVSERERIARELHDTFLQGLYAVLLRFHTVTESIPTELPARKIMEDTLDRAENVLTQGRESVRGLRGELSLLLGIDEEIQCFAEECKLSSESNFNLSIRGEHRTLHHVIHDEVVQIAKEAVLNAFRHSGAAFIQVRLCFDRHFFSLEVTDDGRGIEPAILAAGGKTGHWGILGMRERSLKMGGQFTIVLRQQGGTEVKLRIPSTLAFTSRSRITSWGQRLRIRKVDSTS